MLGQPFVVENKGGAGGNLARRVRVTAPTPTATRCWRRSRRRSPPTPCSTRSSTSIRPSSSRSRSCRRSPNMLLVQNDFPAKNAEGVHRLREGQSRQAELRLAGHGTTSHLTGATVRQAATGTKIVPRALQGHRARAINDLLGRPCRPDLHAARSRDQAARRRQGAAPRRHHREAHRRAAGHSDHGRGRAEGLHLRHLERDLGAAQDAAADRRQAQRGGQRGAARCPRCRSSTASCTCSAVGGTPEDMAKIMKEDTERWGEVIKAAKVRRSNTQTAVARSAALVVTPLRDHAPSMMDQASRRRRGERDHFIPARKIDVLDAVIADGALASEPEREKFRQFCRLLGAIYHYEYFDQLERLRNDYFYFSPDLDGHARFDSATVERAYRDLIDALTEGAARRELHRGSARGDRARPSRARHRPRQHQGAARRLPRGSVLPARPSQRNDRDFRSGSACASAASSSASMTTSCCW